MINIAGWELENMHIFKKKKGTYDISNSVRCWKNVSERCRCILVLDEIAQAVTTLLSE
jgi:hypothetical protein